MFGGVRHIIRLKKDGSVFLESVICLIIFIVISLFMSNFIIRSSKNLILNSKISSDILKLREFEFFLASEMDEYAFDFKILSNSKISYKRIVPVDYEECEVKEREMSFKNGFVNLKYDNKNTINLLKEVEDFNIYKNGQLIFIDLRLGSQQMTKIISSMSYGI